MRTIGLRVLSFNVRAIACHQRCGFREVAREPVSLNGEPATDILMEVAAPGHRTVTAVPAGACPSPQ